MTENKPLSINKRSKRKNRLPDETLPYFDHGWSCEPHYADRLLNDYALSARNNRVRDAQRAAICTLLANLANQPGNWPMDNKAKKMILPNFSELLAESWGYSREVFCNVLEYLEDGPRLIARLRERDESGKHTRSEITFSGRLIKYAPQSRYYVPSSPLYFKLPGEKKKTMAKVNTSERKQIKERIRSYWESLKYHNLKLGITREEFNILNDYQVEVIGKEKLEWPDETKFLPYMSFSDKDLTQGGRFYGAFWINCKKEIRKKITIDGELTADIDGKAMHVQLLYRNKGLLVPVGDPYLSNDAAERSIYKKLMILMLNTAEEFSPETGRLKVANTFIYHHGKEHGLNKQRLILPYIERLEAHHSTIADELYKPNWGRLHKTEAAIMLRIMERGMSDGVVVLPVHDGGLCPISQKSKVLEYFEAEGIKASENFKHLEPLNIEVYKTGLYSHRTIKRAA